MRVLAIQHNDTELPGLVGQRARQRGLAVETLTVSDDVVYPDPRRFDAIIPLGAPESVRDTHVAWIPRELDMLHRAVEHDVPVLGICFGGQMLAHVLGGEVRRGDAPEVGWTEVETLDPELISAQTWFELHFDVFSVPPGGRELARNDAGPQAFAAGSHLGVQFHPEMTPAILAVWLSRWRSLFDELGVDVDALVCETHQRQHEARAATDRLVDAWLARLGAPA